LAIAASGLRISLGPWHSAADLEALVQTLKMALAAAGNQRPAATRDFVPCIMRPGEAAIPLDLEVFDRSGLFGVVVHAVHHLNKPRRLRKI
jgi:hypothetical protein